MNESLPTPDLPPDVLTVSQLTGLVRGTLEEKFNRIWVVGEISGLAQPRSGHVYLSLKDDRSQLSAVIWRSTAQRVKFDLKDGLEVLVSGSLTVYEPRGQYQFIVQRIQPRGVGALQLAFLQLKEKLEKEGLFDEEHKKPLPFIPRRIALITSPTGAAIRDMLKQLAGRFPGFDALVVPVRVQGDQAAGEIADAIRLVNTRDDIDLIITGRGGGSIEDLWAFNEEVVARAIYASEIPVISAVGHEVDVTIADLVADARALTPTAAGEMAVPEKALLHEQIDQLAQRLNYSLATRLELARSRLDSLTRAISLSHPLEMIRHHQQHLDELLSRMQTLLEHRTSIGREQLGSLAGALEALSPLKVLGRGYSITLGDGKIIKRADDVQPGDRLEVIVKEGRIQSIVESTSQEGLGLSREEAT